MLLEKRDSKAKNKPKTLPTVSIVDPCWCYLFRILIIELVKPKTGTTMETIGKP